MRFDWDPAKAADNQRKHGIGFEMAKLVFSDPLARAEQDRIEGGEYRWQTNRHCRRIPGGDRCAYSQGGRRRRGDPHRIGATRDPERTKAL